MFQDRQKSKADHARDKAVQEAPSQDGQQPTSADALQQGKDYQKSYIQYGQVGAGSDKVDSAFGPLDHGGSGHTGQQDKEE